MKKLWVVSHILPNFYFPRCPPPCALASLAVLPDPYLYLNAILACQVFCSLLILSFSVPTSVPVPSFYILALRSQLLA